MKETLERVSLRQLNRWTLARQMLLERAHLDPVTAIERLAGLQAQWPRSPYVALWSRLRDFRAADLEAALIEGRVVKSNLMRVTLHLVSAAEFHLYRAAVDADAQSGWSGSAVAAGESLPAIRAELIARAAAGALSRSQALAVMEALAPAMEDVDRRRLWYLLKSAHLVADPGHALFGSSPQGDHVLAPTLPEVTREVAMIHLVRAHLAAFGPATRADTANWTGHTVGELLPAYAALADELVELTGPDGDRLVDLRTAPRPPVELPAPVRFLAKWDSLLLGHKRRTRVISDEHRRVVIRKNGDVTETFTIDGFVAGTWGVTQKGGIATLSVAPFIPLSKPLVTELEAEGERLLRFLAPAAKELQLTVRADLY